MQMVRSTKASTSGQGKYGLATSRAATPCAGGPQPERQLHRLALEDPLVDARPHGLDEVGEGALRHDAVDGLLRRLVRLHHHDAVVLGVLQRELHVGVALRPQRREGVLGALGGGPQPLVQRLEDLAADGVDERALVGEVQVDAGHAHADALRDRAHRDGRLVAGLGQQLHRRPEHLATQLGAAPAGGTAPYGGLLRTPAGSRRGHWHILAHRLGLAEAEAVVQARRGRVPTSWPCRRGA
jgi:hypothetical protein